MPTPSITEPIVKLKARRAKPFFLRHPWVFSGAVREVLGAPDKGQVVAVVDDRGRFIGRGFYNADSQIVVRLFTWDPDQIVDDAFWKNRLEIAVQLRRRLPDLGCSTNAYRLVFSDADGLPGLIVDRYADILVTQFLTAGMARRRQLIFDALMELISPRGIYERSDDEATAKEGISPVRRVVRGEVTEEVVPVQIDGLPFLVDIVNGQKTGFFLDQRENRLAAARYLGGLGVLDAFSYTGAFSVTACRIGNASEVLALDRSAPTVELARRNFELNGITCAQAKVAQVAVELRALKKSGRRFGGVILDPPKFARSRHGVARALRAYRDVNLLAMQLLASDGVLVTCSCSGHVSLEQFSMMLNEAAVEAGVSLQILERRGQASDHPVISSCPEMAYLKCFICRVIS